MNHSIRLIEERDITGFHQALSSVVKEGNYLSAVEAPSIEQVSNFVKNNIKNNYAQYICEINSEIIGWADIIPNEKMTMQHSGKLGMGVTLAFRGQSIGKKLLEKAIAHAWSSGLTRLELEVFSDNHVAINLYKKMGYEIEGVKKYARFYIGRYQDRYMMAQYRI